MRADARRRLALVTSCDCTNLVDSTGKNLQGRYHTGCRIARGDRVVLPGWYAQSGAVRTAARCSVPGNLLKSVRSEDCLLIEN